MASFYQGQLVILVAACVGIFLLERYFLRKATTPEGSTERSAPPAVVSGLSRRYLFVYTIIMGGYGRLWYANTQRTYFA